MCVWWGSFIRKHAFVKEVASEGRVLPVEMVLCTDFNIPLLHFRSVQVLRFSVLFFSSASQ